MVTCPYCGAAAKCVDSAEIYGKSYGWAWICRPCDAYVGCHKGTKTPLGRLADSDLRAWKKRVHAVFDPLWKNGRLKRGEAYKWLADHMNLPLADCHIGMFDIKQCRNAYTICKWENI